DEGREDGGCWLWLTDATHEMTRGLVLNDRVQINNDGRYLLGVDDFWPGLSLSVREELTRRLAARLSEYHSLSATYHSVLGNDNPDGLPHYSYPPLENTLIFNYGNDKADC